MTGLMNNTFTLFFAREWQLMFRNTSSLVQPLCFFVIIALLFPFSLAAENSLLSKIGSGVIWVSAVLATLLSLESMFRHALYHWQCWVKHSHTGPLPA